MIADLGVHYLAEAFLNDELLIEIGIMDIKHKSLDILYKVTNVRTKKTVAKAKTGAVFFKKIENKTTAIPQSLLLKLQK